SQGRDTILASNKIASEMLGQTLPAPTDAELQGIVFNSIELLLLPSQGRDTILASNKIASEMLGQTLPAPTDAELQG
ncbi:hypothetical protein CTI14_69245, partial [Methylobacterium radiotolerans]